MTAYDVVIVGLGAMGSAAAYELAARSVRVLGVDRHSPPHTLGSTHGRTRIVREAYYEHPLYVPLVRRAFERWSALEHAIGEPLWVRTGGLMIGPETGELVSGALRSAREHDIPHELLDGRELTRRFPVMRPPTGAVGLLERRAGLLFPESCVSAFLTLAARHGAELRTDVEVTDWRAASDAVEVRTSHGVHRCGQLLLAAGSWIPELARCALPLEVERQLLHWFEPASDASLLRAEVWPLALWEVDDGRLFATFPDTGDGVKVGVHHEGEVTDPRRIRREISPAEDEDVRALLARLVPAAAGRLRESRVCLYTNTPDHHFLIDRLPEDPRVLVVSACSGHGFKFASALGELVADLLTGTSPRFDVSAFSLARFGD